MTRCNGLGGKIGAVKIGNATDAPCFSAAIRKRGNLSFRADLLGKAARIGICRSILEGAVRAGSGSKRGPEAEKTGGVRGVSYFPAVKKGNAMGAPCFSPATGDRANQIFLTDFPAKAAGIAIGLNILEGVSIAGSGSKRGPDTPKTVGVRRVSYFPAAKKAAAPRFSTRKGANH